MAIENWENNCMLKEEEVSQFKAELIGGIFHRLLVPCAVPAVKTQKVTHFKQTLQVFQIVNKENTANFTLGNNKVEAFE